MARSKSDCALIESWKIRKVRSQWEQADPTLNSNSADFVQLENWSDHGKLVLSAQIDQSKYKMPSFTHAFYELRDLI